jgi:hypothetical protein
MEKNPFLNRMEQTALSCQRDKREKQLKQSRSRRLFLILYYKSTIASKISDSPPLSTLDKPLSHLESTSRQEKDSEDFFHIEFLSQTNSLECKNIVITWLLADWRRRGFPFEHFWHNRDFISAAFDDHLALVAFNQKREFVGFMTWSVFLEMRAEIEIVNVKEAFWGQGIFKLMQNALVRRFPELRVFSATVLPQARMTFTNAGWIAMGSKHLKLIQPQTEPLKVLPQKGRHIALCFHDFFDVDANMRNYENHLRFFPLILDKKSKLIEPIMTEHCCVGYVAVYLDNELIAKGRVRHLFSPECCNGIDDIRSDQTILLISAIIPTTERWNKDQDNCIGWDSNRLNEFFCQISA